MSFDGATFMVLDTDVLSTKDEEEITYWDLTGTNSVLLVVTIQLRQRNVQRACKIERCNSSSLRLYVVWC